MVLQNSTVADGYSAITLDWARLGCPITACNVCLGSGPAKRTVDRRYVCTACDKKYREEKVAK